MRIYACVKHVPDTERANWFAPSEYAAGLYEGLWENRWFWAIGYSIFCVFVECLLNIGGHLVWEYPFRNL